MSNCETCQVAKLRKALAKISFSLSRKTSFPFALHFFLQPRHSLRLSIAIWFAMSINLAKAYWPMSPSLSPSFYSS